MLYMSFARNKCSKIFECFSVPVNETKSFTTANVHLVMKGSLLIYILNIKWQNRDFWNFHPIFVLLMSHSKCTQFSKNYAFSSLFCDQRFHVENCQKVFLATFNMLSCQSLSGQFCVSSGLGFYCRPLTRTVGGAALTSNQQD